MLPVIKTELPATAFAKQVAIARVGQTKFKFSISTMNKFSPNPLGIQADYHYQELQERESH